MVADKSKKINQMALEGGLDAVKLGGESPKGFVESLRKSDLDGAFRAARAYINSHSPDDLMSGLLRDWIAYVTDLMTIAGMKI